MHCTERSRKYHVTFHGLQKWYKAMFEKLGWMLLAQRDGRIHKVNSYKRGVTELLEAIEEKIHCTHDADRIEDLRILHKNSSTLKQHVDVDFKTERRSGRR